MFIFLFACSDAVLLHAYTGDVISLSVKANGVLDVCSFRCLRRACFITLYDILLQLFMVVVLLILFKKQ